MKLSSTAVLVATGLAATASAANISPNTIYKFKVIAKGTQKPGLNESILALKDESAGTTPAALGVWNSGEPRNPYTFTLSKSSLSDKLYEINGAVKKTHLVLYGNSAAFGVYDVPKGADPKVSNTEKLFTNQWWATDIQGPLQLFHPEKFEAGTQESVNWQGAGSWRMCYGNSTSAFPDYQLVWYDGKQFPSIQLIPRSTNTEIGLSNLNQYFGTCEGALTIRIVEHTTASSTSGFMTGVSAPTTTDSKGNWITGVTAPSSNGTGNSTDSSKPASFEGGASQVGFAGMFLSIALGAAALVL